jgi:hypothetical protein
MAEAGMSIASKGIIQYYATLISILFFGKLDKII